jgi:hypothetical protein
LDVRLDDSTSERARTEVGALGQAEQCIVLCVVEPERNDLARRETRATKRLR